MPSAADVQRIRTIPQDPESPWNPTAPRENVAVASNQINAVQRLPVRIAGIERRILEKISARLEYRYSDLGDGGGTFDRHRMLAGIAYRF